MNSDSSAPAIPDGLSVIAFGDVHGCFDKLDPLLGAITRRVEGLPERRHLVVSVGDLIDRGPDSAKVVERMIAGVPGCETIVLRGNHEQMMLDFIHGGENEEDWLFNGGLRTMMSYGVDIERFLAERPEIPEMRRALLERLPVEHLRFLDQLPSWFECGDYFFVHAGVRPGRPLDKQHQEDLLWIRDGFLDWEGDFGRKIIHGHTPVEVPTFRHNRVNLDTGACFGGPLTAVLIEEQSLALFGVD